MQLTIHPIGIQMCGLLSIVFFCLLFTITLCPAISRTQTINVKAGEWVQARLTRDPPPHLDNSSKPMPPWWVRSRMAQTCSLSLSPHVCIHTIERKCMPCLLINDYPSVINKLHSTCLVTAIVIQSNGPSKSVCV